MNRGTRATRANPAQRGLGEHARVVLYTIISVAFTVWFTALIRARWIGDGPLRARAGRPSYATYVLHPLVLTAIMVAFAARQGGRVGGQLAARIGGYDAPAPGPSGL
jgi:peptidoglycan/LPS O-acetylase OafA/YrhL